MRFFTIKWKFKLRFLYNWANVVKFKNAKRNDSGLQFLNCRIAIQSKRIKAAITSMLLQEAYLQIYWN